MGSESEDLRSYAREKVLRARRVLRELMALTTEVKNRTLLRASEILDSEREKIKEENEKDLQTARELGLRESVIDRLLLNDKRIDGMIKVLRDVASLPDPVGEVIRMWTLPNGLKVGRMRVPLGVVFIVYESRPNVTIEAASLCMKSSNAVILRGGKEAVHSNRVLVDVLRRSAREEGFPEEAIQFIDRTEREIVWELLSMEGLIDVAIPRGGEGLIRAVADHSKVPVIKHYKGVCNIYVDDRADLDKAYDIVYNAKVQRPSVCNAVENLLINRKVLEEFFPKMALYLGSSGVELRCDEESLKILKEKGITEKVKAVPAKEEDYYEEFLDLILAVKTVGDLDEAIEFIGKYGSGHSDAIITEDYSKAMKFLREVDSAAVYVNASTRFTDGNEFGLGAEMGISTDKVHARGPMALEELTIPKFIILGEGQIRDNFGVPEDLKEDLKEGK